MSNTEQQTGRGRATSVRLPEDMKELIKKIAEKERRSFTQQLCYLIEKGIHEEQN